MIPKALDLTLARIHRLWNSSVIAGREWLKQKDQNLSRDPILRGITNTCVTGDRKTEPVREMIPSFVGVRINLSLLFVCLFVCFRSLCFS